MAWSNCRVANFKGLYGICSDNYRDTLCLFPKIVPNLNTGNDRYSGKNGQGFLFHYSGCFHYSGRLLYGTQHISSPSFQFKNEIRTSFTSMVGWGLESCVAMAFKTEFWLRLLQWFLIGSKILVFESHAVSFWPQEKGKESDKSYYFFENRRGLL